MSNKNLLRPLTPEEMQASGYRELSDKPVKLDTFVNLYLAIRDQLNPEYHPILDQAALNVIRRIISQLPHRSE